MSKDEMRGFKTNILESIKKIQTIVEAAPRSNGEKYGFYGKKSSEGTVFKQRHPFSNFHLEPIEVAGHVFRCAEAVIMFCKSLRFGDGQVAHALLHGAHAGTTCKQLGRMVRGFIARKWKPKSVAMFVVMLKREQCPLFRAELAKVKGRRIYECSPSDKVWGTGTSLAQFPFVGDDKSGNYLGKALTVAASLQFD